MRDSATADQAKRTLLDLFDELAPAEALTRAFVSERNGDRELAMMWIDIYREICADQARPQGSAIVRL